MSGQTHRLDTRHISLVFYSDGGMPSLIFLGERLADDIDLEHFAASRTLPIGNASLDNAAPVSLCPEPSRGFSGHPGLSTRSGKPGSNDWAGQFVLETVKASASDIEFKLSDPHRKLGLSLRVTIDQHSSVALMKSQLTNAGSAECVVDWLSAPVVSVPQHYSHYLQFHGRWCGEFATERQDVPIGQVAFENRRGRTSHESFPGLVVLEGTTDENQGDCIGLHLAWSGNHRLMLERSTTGECQFQAGHLTLPNEIVLGPGQAVESPDLILTLSSNGLNGLSQRFHDYVRSSVLNLPDNAKHRPVTLNTWEAIYFDHDIDRLKALADAGKRMGVERFVLDDGWFKGRSDDTSSLGDWLPDPVKYPEGLHDIANHVTDMGMEFGLWVEPEMVNPESDLYRAYPDWVLGVDDLPKITGRQQLVLDLTNDEVTDYLFSYLDRLLSEYPISYLKWDMNRILVTPGDKDGKPAALRQTQALYRLIDRLREAHPDVEIESCASGGGRIDFEILKRTDRFWTSDSNDPIERMHIQKGFSYFLPLELMGAHVGPTWCHTSGRGFDMIFRAAVASVGHMGVELDLTRLGDEEFEVLKAAIDRHKQDREIWHSGTLFRLETCDSNLFGMCAISNNKLRARVMLAQIDRPRAIVPPVVRLAGLDPKRRYNISVIEELTSKTRATRFFDNPLAGGELILAGDVIQKAGIQLPVLYAQTALSLQLEAL